MANSLAAVAPRLLAAGVLALRQQAITPRLVNRSYDGIAAQYGSVIDIPIPSAMTATDVAPSATPTAPEDVAPTYAQITMDFWKKAAFGLTDKEVQDVMQGVIPMQTSEAIKTLVNAFDVYLLTKMKNRAFNYAGTAGTTPFASDLSVYHTSRKQMNREAAPMDDRRVLLDADAEGNALALAQFLSADQRGDQGGIIRGQIGNKIGADWYMNQNVRTHTPGVPGGSPTGTGTLGSSTVAVAGAGAAGTYVQGDVISFANHTQTYVVTADVTLSGTGTGNLSIYPPLRLAVSASAITLRAAHVANLHFHRDAVGMASRPMAPVPNGLGSIITQTVDEVSGLALRLEITRQNKQVKYEFDILAGAVVIRPELIARIAG